jgi:hypothetical protein
LGDTLSWWDLACIIENLPASSAYSRYLDPDAIYRTPENMIAILAADGARGTNALFKLLVSDPASRPEPPKKSGVVIDARAEIKKRQAQFAAQKAAEAV